MSEIKYNEMSLERYLDVLSSKEPTVGGGTVAALQGAMAASLVSMVANLTIGRKKYDHVQLMMQDILKQADALQKDFMSWMQKDSEAFQLVMNAYRLDKEDSSREQAIELAYKKAAETPLEVAKCAVRCGYLAVDAAEFGNINAKSDGLVGAMSAYASAKSALWNVKINLDQIKDTAFLSSMLTQIATLEKENESLKTRWSGLEF